MHLYTYKDDVVLDPFMGAGSTAVAAVNCGRHFVGYDTEAEYITLAEGRVAKAREALEIESPEMVKTVGPWMS
jgi:DNA modification methylase